ncbi:hypothetical protein N0V88_003707 [Collariella sp. IMI 366227]|nr:hypothetical protein N0V88_003707 [Collariella sp. IMI 366227]
MKFRLSSLFHSSPPSPVGADAEAKKQNRRSFSLAASLRHKEAETNGAAAAPDQQQPNVPQPETAAVPEQSPSRMVALAQKIARETEKLEAFMKANNLPMPSFDIDAPADWPKLPEDVLKSRQEIIFATKELGLLAHGPRESVRWGVWEFLDVLALTTLNHYGIAWVGFNGEDIFRASGHVVQALKAHPEATSLVRSGFQFAFDTVDKEPMFATFGKDPERARRMGKAMVSLTGGEGYETGWFVDGCDLQEVDEKEGVFVDVGGSHGFMCVELARKWRRMRFVVQDLPRTVETAPRPVCEDEQVAGRIELRAHDFFTEQVVQGADVYYFRWIMHNYSTPYAVRILRNLIPALKPGARIIINDHCLREPGQENPWDEKVMRRMDVVMLALLNAQERTEQEFRDLFKEAGDGFVFKGVQRPEGCRMSIVEAVWQPEKVEKAEAPAAAESETVIASASGAAELEAPVTKAANGSAVTENGVAKTPNGSAVAENAADTTTAEEIKTEETK